MIEKIKAAIENLNEELFFALEHWIGYEEGSLEFIFRSDGGTIIVEFLGFDLWNSEDDERVKVCSSCKPYPCAHIVGEGFQYSTEYEPIENFLRQEANKRIQMIKNLYFTGLKNKLVL